METKWSNRLFLILLASFFGLVHLAMAAESWQDLQRRSRMASEGGDYPKAIGFARQALETAEAMDTIEPTIILPLLVDLGELYRSQGQHEEAEPVLRRALNSSVVINGTKHPQTKAISDSLMTTYERLGRMAEANLLRSETASSWGDNAKTSPYDYSRVRDLLAYTPADLSRMSNDQFTQYLKDVGSEIRAINVFWEANRSSIDLALHRELKQREELTKAMTEARIARSRADAATEIIQEEPVSAGEYVFKVDLEARDKAVIVTGNVSGGESCSRLRVDVSGHDNKGNSEQVVAFADNVGKGGKRLVSGRLDLPYTAGIEWRVDDIRFECIRE